MDERELSTDSDESDADYVPSGPESNPPSEVESEEEEEDETRSEDELETAKRRKSRPMGGKKKKKLKSSGKKKEPVEDKEEEEPTKEEKLLTAEEEKKKADSLWSDFLKDTKTTDSKKPVTNGSQKELSPALKAENFENFENTRKENIVTITKLFEFAGEEVRVTKEVAADSVEARLSAAPGVPFSIPAGDKKLVNIGRGRGGLKGLSSVLGQIGKKAKLGTLEKSKLDWDRYKKDEGIEEELQRHNKGKDGYLEKQDFLQRTDLRQFEIEKGMRTSRRSNR